MKGRDASSNRANDATMASILYSFPDYRAWWRICLDEDMVLLPQFAISETFCCYPRKINEASDFERRKAKSCLCGVFSSVLVRVTWSQRLTSSNAGGGGERVLWTAIKAIQKEFPDVISVVYSGDVEVTPNTILDNVQV